ncbi:MAG: carbon-phosphorus lyase complex subunit PhnI [Polaromonas sp. 24-62-144]|jgi:alpha-D-ribose 1-methylphosphonate 5-triphosphate synthase subunit PhnI|uniref:carbon-phosphorus lyase complex subunit PhnI n=1 Tax=Polaromonas sp. TaxID=1869339 RepID=UPI000BD71824|nr:carbon-phosphorus lyase complex subunit PhnI [Polaromonas sp.]OYY53286.1 MAG: carbon-phosphorus lyase complex subunit PhnI [Polaromonas sp. 35-63-240]OYZ02037.1 MAG: carbon-phosphorus lyase complex subunit PhnI [Polaromonas sp. 28-63-22]OYZ84438.1 MAG: carbon-phosphorus lyase complex subunit PhnI [Polaromonas sp. 24-62-144]HQS30185.1 carbon-phosphorus lyase complex subunit PhnI [Polaromonas sp.]HQS89582.1 carbon-phosphorus lyase complex subunit PhnI [Polaromonas sp.]
MYVAVKGGAAAIESSWRLLDAQRRGDTALGELSVAQIRAQLSLAVDRVMSEGSLFDPELAALAIKQASGDLLEAVFLLRAYRTTLPRFGYSEPLDTARIALLRRISATFKEVPGGQLLGPTYDYTQRLLDFALLAEGEPGDAKKDPSQERVETPVQMAPAMPTASGAEPSVVPRINDLLAREGLLETPQPVGTEPPGDLTREPLMYPADRALRLQALARGDEGWLMALGYSTQRGYANTHPFAGEIRRGFVAVELVPDELGFALDIGDLEVTECQMINQFSGNKDIPPQFTQGYGLAFGGSERKAMAMALVDRALRADELGEPRMAPAQDEEFVLSHADNVEASGFVQHLKLPHYVDFQAELELVRKMRAEHAHAANAAQEKAA